MHYFRKKICAMTAAAAIASVLSVPASAAGASVSAYSKEQKTVTFAVTEKPNGTDFVRQFPSINMESVVHSKRPSAELAQQKRQNYLSVPLYFQNDYPDIQYGNGTVETSGCSITSMAMVATYLTGYEYLPDELAYYFGGRAVNNIARLEYAAQTLGIPYEKPENWHYTLEELHKGKIAIVLVSEASDFTDSQHFLVLTGVTEDGKILVNDSYEPNYQKWNLKKGFAEGFSESDICRGYQGAWVFDKSEISAKLARYTEKEPDVQATRYPGVELTFAERQLLAKVVWVESRGESAEGQQAVAEIALNRLVSDAFPDNLRDVIYGEGQFRSAKFLDDADPGQAQYQAIERALYGPNILPMDVTYFARFAVNNNVWGTIGGHIFCYQEEKPEREPTQPEETASETIPTEETAAVTEPAVTQIHPGENTLPANGRPTPEK